jgi:hypothetical protein
VDWQCVPTRHVFCIKNTKKQHFAADFQAAPLSTRWQKTDSLQSVAGLLLCGCHRNKGTATGCKPAAKAASPRQKLQARGKSCKPAAEVVSPRQKLQMRGREGIVGRMGKWKGRK